MGSCMTTSGSGKTTNMETDWEASSDCAANSHSFLRPPNTSEERNESADVYLLHNGVKSYCGEVTCDTKLIELLSMLNICVDCSKVNLDITCRYHTTHLKPQDYQREKDKCLGDVIQKFGSCSSLRVHFGIPADIYYWKNSLVLYSFEKRIEVKRFHVSKYSDQNTEDGLVGMVLYMHNGTQEWDLKNHHCEAGDIILKSPNSNDIDVSNDESALNSLYTWYTNEPLYDDDVVLGFYFRQGRIQNMYSLHYKNDVWHYNNDLNPIEKEFIHQALDNWVHGEQDTTVSDNYCILPCQQCGRLT